MLVRATNVFIIWIRTASHVRQKTSISATVDAKTRIICHAIVACPTACLVAECIVAAGDEAAVKLVAGGRVACAVAYEDVGVAHGCMLDAPLQRMVRVVAGGCERWKTRTIAIRENAAE